MTALLTAAAVGPASLLIAWPAAAAGSKPVASPKSAAPAKFDRTTPREARRVDRVKLAKIRWSKCADAGAECAVIRLPLDYDEPNGPTTRVALGRLKAAKPKQRIGTLFVNNGGPGYSSVEFAVGASAVLGQEILDRFDIVGVDPRGVGGEFVRGDVVQCFKNSREQLAVFNGYALEFPVTRDEIRAQIRAARGHAKGCGTTGLPLAASMSTAQVARDMDVVRRALGEKKLTYYGISYGTQLGQVYANMFPDRVRALALDSVLDPVAWTTGRSGTSRTVPVGGRMGSGEASYRAFRELMRRCDKVGAPVCAFAGSGNSLKKFDVLAKRLKKKPHTVGGEVIFTYAGLVGYVTGGMYDELVGAELATYLQDTFTATDPKVAGVRRDAAGRRAAAGISRLRAALRPGPGEPQALGVQKTTAPLYAFGKDVFTAVVCSDSVNPKSPKAWIAAGAAADRRTPYFGSVWNWNSTACARSIWTARDEDRYLGPFNKRTANPVLMVNNDYDPSTPYAGAAAASKLLPGSRLLKSKSWGHIAYVNNTCVADAVDAYLLRGTLPAKGTVCTGPQPFEQTAAPQSMRPRGSTWPVPFRPLLPGLGG